MTSYALNVRIEQIDAEKRAVRLRRPTLPRALEAATHEVLLFASRDEGSSSYFATAVLGDPLPDVDDRTHYWLPLYNLRNLDRPVTLKELEALGLTRMPFHTFAHPIRVIEPEVIGALDILGVLPPGFGEPDSHRIDDLDGPSIQSLARTSNQIALDYRQVRFEMFEAYGLKCAFSRHVYQSLDGSRNGIDVGHIWPHGAGGPTIIQNVLPMCKDINYQWDEGLIGLTNNGDLLLTAEAGSDTRQLLRNFKKISFPANPQLWPDAKYLELHRTEIFGRGPIRFRR